MRKVWPILLTIVGLIVFGLGVGQAIGGVAGTINSIGTPWMAAQPTTQTLSEGGYVIYERAMMPTVSASDITITGPQGDVPVGTPVSSTVTIGNTTYVGVAGFTAGVAGEYTITVRGSESELVLGPSVAKTLGGAFVWIGAAVLGGLLAFAGLVWLVVVLVVGRKPAGVAAAPPGAMASAGIPPATQSSGGSWYPDPEDPGQWRWWDGREWTDRRAPRQ